MSTTTTSQQQRIQEFLSQNGIQFECYEHPAISTCEEAKRFAPPMPGVDTKNLFLRDHKGEKHFLLVTTAAKQVDLKALSDVLKVKKLGFASAVRLRARLNVEPGSVTLLAIINDESNQVQLLIDQDVWGQELVQCHPLVNTATLVIPWAGIEKFINLSGHKPKIVDVPIKCE